MKNKQKIFNQKITICTNKSDISIASSVDLNNVKKSLKKSYIQQNLDYIQENGTPTFSKFSQKANKIEANSKKLSIGSLRENIELNVTNYVDRSKLFINSFKEYMKTKNSRNFLHQSKTEESTRRRSIARRKCKKNSNQYFQTAKNSNFVSIFN